MLNDESPDQHSRKECHHEDTSITGAFLPKDRLNDYLCVQGDGHTWRERRWLSRKNPRIVVAATPEIALKNDARARARTWTLVQFNIWKREDVIDRKIEG
jgi:hypothetical protein